MELMWVVLGGAVFAFLGGVYVRDRQLRPAAGGGTFRYVLRWALLVVGLLTVLTVADATGTGWLSVVSGLALALVALLVARDLLFSRRDRSVGGVYPATGGSIRDVDVRPRV